MRDTGRTRVLCAFVRWICVAVHIRPTRSSERGSWIFVPEAESESVGIVANTRIMLPVFRNQWSVVSSGGGGDMLSTTKRISLSRPATMRTTPSLDAPIIRRWFHTNSRRRSPVHPRARQASLSILGTAGTPCPIAEERHTRGYSHPSSCTTCAMRRGALSPPMRSQKLKTNSLGWSGAPP